MADPLLDPYSAKILEHLAKHLVDEEAFLTEFTSLINNYDPDIKSGAVQPLPLVSPSSSRT